MIRRTVSFSFQSLSVSIPAAYWKLELKLVRGPYRSLSGTGPAKLIDSYLPSTIASWARLITLNLELDIFAIVVIFERAFQAVCDILIQ